jgi:hypothetical protein
VKTIQLTQGQVALVDDDDFEWLSQWRWCVLKSRHGFYAKRSSKGIMMHREIVGQYGLAGPSVDHINHDGLDNQKVNLRACTQSENQANRRKTIGSSRFKGVHFEAQTQRWRPMVKCNGRTYRGPRFDAEELAAAWYDKMACELFGDFALINVQ